MNTTNYQKNAYLPVPPDNEIFRESLIINIVNMFYKNRTILLLNGPESSGKTVLLSQFARYHEGKCISLFLQNNYWSSNLSSFLLELCLQLQQIPAISSKFNKELSNIEFKEEHLLKQLFYRMHRALVSHVKTTGEGPFYFIIDGLDKVEENYGEDNILRYLPPSDPSGVYLLLSSNKENTALSDYETIPIQYFSLEETIEFFYPILEKEQARLIYEVSKGMPGYLAGILKEIKQSPSKNYSSLLSNLPKTYIKLVEREWEKIDQNNTNILKILSTLIISTEPLNEEKLSEILSLEKSAISLLIKGISFVELDETNCLFINNAFKNIIKGKLDRLMPETTQLLITYYEKKQIEDSAQFLPSLYLRNENYDSLVNLISVENITKILGTQRSVSLIRRNIRLLSEMAYKKNDNQRVVWGALTESFFTELISSPPAIENQIKALLAQDNFEYAIQLAYSCILPEDRLMLFSKIGNEMIKKERPVPIEIIKTIEESVELIDNTVELTESLADKLLEICTDLITLKTNIALDLIEKIAELKGTSNHKNQLMDMMLVNVLIEAGPDDTTAEKIKSQISNESINDFAQAASVLGKVSINEVFKQVEQLNDISAKIYLLQSWCNSNEDNQNLCEVVKYSLDLMNSSSAYSPTQLQLRRLVQCLLPNIETHNEERLKELVDQFDLFKGTILRHPLDENARLELTLASIIKKWDPVEASDRYYNVYFSVDSISDIDIRCFIIIRLLLTRRELVPEEPQLEKEFKDELDKSFEELLNSSADHLGITKKIIASITKYDHFLAASYAGKLNTVRRRDFAYGEVLRQYTLQSINSSSIKFINELLEKITNISYHDWVFVQIIKRLTKSSNKTKYEEKVRYLEKLYNISHTTGKCYAFAYFIVWIWEDNSEKAIQLFEDLKITFQQIDCLWEQVRVGFEISSILTSANMEFSSEIYYLTENQKNSSVFADESVTNMFIDICKLVIRMTPDILTTNKYKELVAFSVNAIDSIPSTLERSILFCSLAIKCLTYNKKDIFTELSQKVLQEIENCNEDITLQQILIETSPMLYEVERNILFDKLNILPIYMRDSALAEVLKYLFTKRVPIDNVDISNYPVKIDYPEALKIVEIIEYLETDAIIHCYIEKLVDSVTERKEKKFKTTFNARQILTIAEKLMNIVDKKLPDQRNILHEGYKVACRISITKLKESLRSSGNVYRSNARWDNLNLSWNKISKEISSIPNNTDKIFLQASAAAEAYYSDIGYAENLIYLAEKGLGDITNSVDRVDRFHIVAKAYHQMSNSRAAKFLLEEAVKQSNAFSSQDTRDQLLGGVIELAHNIDPNFASDLSTNIDSPMFLSKTRDNLLALTLRNDPTKIDVNRKEEFVPIISTACTKILNSLYSGRSIIQHEEVIAKWMYCSLGYEFETVSKIALWYVENSISSRSNSLNNSKFDSLYSETLQLLDMISKMSSFSGTAVTNISNSNTFLENIAPKMHTFKVGQKAEAMSFLKNWLQENAREYVKIYDYHYSQNDLELLKYLPQNINVKIISSMRQKDLNVSKIQEKYKEEWKLICEQIPPETTIYIFATPTGRTPQHDRFIITEKGGLVLGTSVNGLGNRDTVINEMDDEEKNKIEKEIVDTLVISPPRYIGEERLICRTFSLDLE